MKIQRRRIFVSAIAVGAIVHFWLYSHGLITPDALWFGEEYIGGWEITSGRWALAYLDYLTGGMCSPIFVALVTLVCYAAAGILIIDMFEVNNKALQYVIPSYLVSSSLAAQTMTYHFSGDAYALAFFAAVICVYLLVKYDGWFSVLLSILILAVALGIYQPNLGVAAGLAVMVLLRQMMNQTFSWERFFRLAVRMLVMGAVGTVLYYVILKVLLHINGLNLSAYKGADGIGVMAILKSLPVTIVQAYHDFGSYFFGESIAVNSYGLKTMHVIVALLFAAAMCIHFLRVKSVLKTIVALLLLAALPLMCNLIDLMTPSTSIYLLMTGGMLSVVPFVFSVVFDELEEMASVKWKRLMQRAALVVPLLLIYSSFLVNNASSLLMWQNEQKALQLANRICYSIEEYGIYDDQKVLIAGVPRFGNYKQRSLLSDDSEVFANWELIWKTYDGSLACWRQLFHRYLGIDLNWCWEYEYRNIAQTEVFRNMPNYPAEGSIGYIEDTLVIKVSDLEE